MATFRITLRRVDRLLTEIGNLLQANGDKDIALRKIKEAHDAVATITANLTDERLTAIYTALSNLKIFCSSLSDPIPDEVLPITEERIAENILGSLPNGSQGRGRPSKLITEGQLRFLVNHGYTSTGIAEVFNCSSSTVKKRLAKYRIKMKERYSQISDQDLKATITELHLRYPNSGSKMMQSYLVARNINVTRQRVRTTLGQVDPDGTSSRLRNALKRRVYSVPCSNSLWHMDGHMKLIRWGFCTHGCIDGYSRLITYLHCATSNEAKVVLHLFAQATVKYGIPSRMRSDHGGENIYVAMLMNLLHGMQRGSHITGKSVHNQRIERLWRDVQKDVIKPFYDKFYSFEDDGILDLQNRLHLEALHSVYLPLINENLELYRQGWNCHKVRTPSSSSKSPTQMWISGLVHHRSDDRTEIHEVFGDTGTLEERVSALLHDHGHVLEHSEPTIDTNNNNADQQLIEILNSTHGDKMKYQLYLVRLNELRS